MGASSSKVKSVTDVVQEAATDIVSSNTASCGVAVGNNQSMKITGIKTGDNCSINIGGLQQKAKLEVSLKCVQTQGTSGDLQQKFDSAIDEKIKVESETGLGLSAAEVDQRKRIRQKIKKNISMANVASCLGSTFNKQDIEIKDVSTGNCPTVAEQAIAKLFGITFGISIKDIQQKAVIKTTVDCVQNQLNALKDDIDFKSTVKSDTSATAKGIDPMIIVYILGALAVCALVAVYVKKELMKPPPLPSFSPPPPMGPPPMMGQQMGPMGPMGQMMFNQMSRF